MLKLMPVSKLSCKSKEMTFIEMFTTYLSTYVSCYFLPFLYQNVLDLLLWSGGFNVSITMMVWNCKIVIIIKVIIIGHNSLQGQVEAMDRLRRFARSWHTSLMSIILFIHALLFFSLLSPVFFSELPRFDLRKSFCGALFQYFLPHLRHTTLLPIFLGSLVVISHSYQKFVYHR